MAKNTFVLCPDRATADKVEKLLNAGKTTEEAAKELGLETDSHEVAEGSAGPWAVVG